jgi:nitrite reductase/ring-hydroxylating ferredoxin subunit
VKDLFAQAVAKSEDVTERKAAVFAYREAAGMLADGFVIRHRGELRAFRNQCPHQPLSLDYGDGEFLDGKNELLLCRNHGAVFESDTGSCVGGPCYGATLKKLQIIEEDGTIYVIPPDPSEMPDLE